MLRQRVKGIESTSSAWEADVRVAVALDERDDREHQGAAPKTGIYHNISVTKVTAQTTAVMYRTATLRGNTARPRDVSRRCDDQD
jgi:hypothetical protein